MGCFLTCFGKSKDDDGSRRRRRRLSTTRKLASATVNENYKILLQNNSAKPVVGAKKVLPRLSSTEENVGEVEVENLKECREKGEVVSCASIRKKVTFDLNVKTYENVAVEEIFEEDEEKAEGGEKEEPFPVDHRYRNCDDDEDYGDDDEYLYEDCEFSDEDEGEILAEGNEESYDSFFSLSIEEEKNGLREVDSSKPKSFSGLDEEKQVVSAKSNVRDRSQYVHSVLNPVENLTQWKEVKVRAAASLKDVSKENVNSEQENKMPLCLSEPIVKAKKLECSINSKTLSSCSAKQEVSVDASLSTWLVSSDNSSVEGPQKSCSHLSISPMSREDRPILGALTVEDIKQSSVTSTPRKSPSRSPDDTPIIGNVGSYWNSQFEKDEDDSGTSRKSGSNSRVNNNGEDRKVNWHTVPFEVRLERALNEGTA